MAFSTSIKPIAQDKKLDKQNFSNEKVDAEHTISVYKATIGKRRHESHEREQVSWKRPLATKRHVQEMREEISKIIAPSKEKRKNVELKKSEEYVALFEAKTINNVFHTQEIKAKHMSCFRTP